MAHPRVAALTAAGTSIWQDDITRGMLRSGTLRRTINEVGIRGLTSNPTIFEKAISSGSDYDAQIGELLKEHAAPLDIFEAVEIDDIRDACDLFQPLYEESDGRDGFCSIEVSPDAARDAGSTRTQVRRLWGKVDRPNVMVKIPGTIEGIPVIEEMLSEGININITLLFSLASYRRVAEAYVAALERRLAAGLAVNQVASVASFFVSRVDTLVDCRGCGRPGIAQGQGRRRQRQTRLRGVPRNFRQRTLRGSAGRRRPPATTALGQHRRQEPGLPGHALRGQLDRAAHGQHHAGQDD
jgi:transketolase